MEQANTTDTKIRYELACVTASEDAASVKALIAKHGGAIVNESPSGKIQLAYKIEKTGYGFMNSIEFVAEPDTVRGISADLSLDKDVVRALVVKKKESKEGGRPAREGDTKAPTPPTRLRSMLGSMLTNEALEKKIEEILQ